MNRTTRLSLIALSVLAAGAASAQAPPPPTGNPAGANPATPAAETGRPARDTANAQDMLFLRQMSLGNTAEVSLAELAKGRAASDGIKSFAARMASDHGGADKRLRPLLQRHDVPARRDLDTDHQVVRKQLEGLRGEAFDTAYIRSQIVDHQRHPSLRHKAEVSQSLLLLGYEYLVVGRSINALQALLDGAEAASRIAWPHCDAEGFCGAIHQQAAAENTLEAAGVRIHVTGSGRIECRVGEDPQAPGARERLCCEHVAGQDRVTAEAARVEAAERRTGIDPGKCRQVDLDRVARAPVEVEIRGTSGAPSGKSEHSHCHRDSA